MYTLDSMFKNGGMIFFGNSEFLPWIQSNTFVIQLVLSRLIYLLSHYSYMQQEFVSVTCSCNISADIMTIFWNSCLQAVSQTQGHVGRILSIVLAHAELYYMPIPLLMSSCFWFLAVLLSWQRHTQVLKGMIWFCSRRLPAICFLHVELSMLSR